MDLQAAFSAKEIKHVARLCIIMVSSANSVLKDDYWLASTDCSSCAPEYQHFRPFDIDFDKVNLSVVVYQIVECDLVDLDLLDLLKVTWVGAFANAAVCRVAENVLKLCYP